MVCDKRGVQSINDTIDFISQVSEYAPMPVRMVMSPKVLAVICPNGLAVLAGATP